ncbi:MAG TPA: hypothetical protein VKD23_02730, partial [Terriglobales bacterium]|nr:hypothetical protein [Terriglobales bacterium]
FSFGFLQNPDFLFLAKPTLLHFVLPFFFAQNSTFATSSFWGSGHSAGANVGPTGRTGCRDHLARGFADGIIQVDGQQRVKSFLGYCCKFGVLT